MRILMKVGCAVGIILGVFAVFLILTWHSPRQSLLGWAALTMAILVFAYLRGWRMKPILAGALLIGLLLAYSPVDVAVRDRTGPTALKFRPVGYGYVSPEGVVNYGCTFTKHSPKYAIVLYIGHAPTRSIDEAPIRIEH